MRSLSFPVRSYSSGGSETRRWFSSRVRPSRLIWIQSYVDPTIQRLLLAGAWASSPRRHAVAFRASIPRRVRQRVAIFIWPQATPELVPVRTHSLGCADSTSCPNSILSFLAVVCGAEASLYSEWGRSPLCWEPRPSEGEGVWHPPWRAYLGRWLQRRAHFLHVLSLDVWRWWTLDNFAKLLCRLATHTETTGEGKQADTPIDTIKGQRLRRQQLSQALDQVVVDQLAAPGAGREPFRAHFQFLLSNTALGLRMIRPFSAPWIGSAFGCPLRKTTWPAHSVVVLLTSLGITSCATCWARGLAPPACNPNLKKPTCCLLPWAPWRGWGRLSQFWYWVPRWKLAAFDLGVASGLRQGHLAASAADGARASADYEVRKCQRLEIEQSCAAELAVPTRESPTLQCVSSPAEFWDGAPCCVERLTWWCAASSLSQMPRVGCSDPMAAPAPTSAIGFFVRARCAAVSSSVRFSSFTIFFHTCAVDWCFRVVCRACFTVYPVVFASWRLRIFTSQIFTSRIFMSQMLASHVFTSSYLRSSHLISWHLRSWDLYISDLRISDPHISDLQISDLHISCLHIFISQVFTSQILTSQILSSSFLFFDKLRREPRKRSCSNRLRAKRAPSVKNWRNFGFDLGGATLCGRRACRASKLNDKALWERSAF